MKLPFFSKKIKKVLKEREDRLFLMTKAQQEEMLNDPDVDIEQKILQVLQENNELKLLYDELHNEISKDLRSGGTYVFSFGHGTMEIITNPKILPSNQIKIGKRIIDIKQGSWVGKIKSWNKTKQFRLYVVEAEGEYTYDPRDETPIEIKRKNELQLQLGHVTAESGIVEAIVKGLGSVTKKWFEYIPYMILLGVVFVFIFFLSQYNLTKPV